MYRIAVIVPAYNEEKSITSVIGDIHDTARKYNLVMDPIVINDCSTDGTAGIIERAPCTALHLPINLGIGGAVQTGFKYALHHDYDYAVQIDGDGQHPAEEIPKLLNKATTGAFDVVIGSRFIDKTGFQSSAIRRVGIRYFKRLNVLLTGQLITDCTSGLRLVNNKVLNKVSEYYPDEYPEPEAIILYALSGFRIAEIPVTMRERQGGISSIGTVSSVYYMLKVTLAMLYTFLRIKYKRK